MHEHDGRMRPRAVRQVQVGVPGPFAWPFGYVEEEWPQMGGRAVGVAGAQPSAPAGRGLDQDIGQRGGQDCIGQCPVGSSKKGTRASAKARRAGSPTSTII